MHHVDALYGALFHFQQIQMLFSVGIKQKMCCAVFLFPYSSDKSAMPVWKLHPSSRENWDGWEITAPDCCFSELTEWILLENISSVFHSICSAD